MTDIIARIKIKGKNYEILVDADKALQLKKGGNVEVREIVATDNIFYDSKKGLHVSDSDLKEAFGTADFIEVAGKIIKQGELQVPKEYRDSERENKKKQIVDFLARHSIDPRTSTPHTPERIANAIDDAGINIDNRPVEQQITKAIEKIKTVLPIKIQTKKLKLRIPSEHTGKVYGLLSEYKETENWLSNGDLECIVNVPIGLQDDFYDKLNSVTHGSALSEEIKEEGEE
jgi:ribosome maturation protein SDO1